VHEPHPETNRGARLARGLIAQEGGTGRGRLAAELAPGADHHNAQALPARLGADPPERELARVPDLVRALLIDDARLAAMGEAMRRASKPDAADVIAEELIALGSAS